ncbi:MAG: hypothetical protein ACI97P_001338, partial [Arcticibacterium sp.]
FCLTHLGASIVDTLALSFIAKHRRLSFGVLIISIVIVSVCNTLAY